METIRILLYTDSCDISKNLHFWGLTDLESFIKLKLASFAGVAITTLNRHIDYKNGGVYKPGATKLTYGLLSKFDELWIFGVLQATSRNPELTKTEIRNLAKWMKTGGVFITGDHSDPIGKNGCGDSHKGFVNLGSALGRNIPRAGELRVWDGPPTGCYDGPLHCRDNFNTQEGDNPEELDDTSLQIDEHPQQLHLIPPDYPHPLFWWYFDDSTQRIVPISCFPDHLHEGKLAYPAAKGKYWPKGSPAPSLVAQGRDKRFTNRMIDLVSVFEGTSEAGRIVADSSFHHYINRNLLRIDGRNPDRSPRPGSDLDQIAQYYANLAIWLAPRRIRHRLGWSLFFWAAQHPDVREERALADHLLGRTALRIVRDEIGISNIYRLLENADDEGERAIGDLLSLVFLGKSVRNEFNVNSEAVLGAVIKECHQSFDKLRVRDPSCLKKDPNPPEVVFRGLSRALQNTPQLLDQLIPLFNAAVAALTRGGDDGKH